MSKLSSETRRETMLGFQPPAIGDEEIAAVAETLRSGWLTTGPRAAELERRMAEYLQAEHVLATIALCQLDKVEQHGEIRRRQFAAYDEAAAELPGITPLTRDDRDVHALHLYVVRVDPETAGATRDEYQRALAEENIATSIHFLPVHKLTFYRERFPDQPALPVAERAGDEILSLPLSPAHSDDDIADAVAALRRVHDRFTG
jgi:dTDP-4-amino-4,6-dideoxygalactose transaminase